MITVTRTHDEAFVLECLTQPHNWAWSRDDGTPSQEVYFLPSFDFMYWLLLEMDGERLGIFGAHPVNAVCYEAHVALLAGAKGWASRAAIAARDWMFMNTPCKRIIVNVLAHNYLAIALAKRAGFEEIGINKKSFLQDGKLYDQVILGVSNLRDGLCQPSQE